MSLKIYPIPLGFDHCYLIQDKGVIMIDGGTSKKAKAFRKAMEKIPIRPEEIQLIVLTHGHWDHLGSVRDIKEITGAKIAIHRRDKDWLESGAAAVPSGVTAWGRFMASVLEVFSPLSHFPQSKADVILGDEGLSLAEYGIPGKVIYTPGHTHGSVSVLLDTGDAFVGDLAMNGVPLRLGPGLPIFAEDLQAVRENWRRLLDQGAKTIYPAHGKPFPADVIRRILS